MRTCRDCGAAKAESLFIGNRTQCNKCRSREQVAREQRSVSYRGIGEAMAAQWGLA